MKDIQIHRYIEAVALKDRGGSQCQMAYLVERRLDSVLGLLP